MTMRVVLLLLLSTVLMTYKGSAKVHVRHGKRTYDGADQHRKDIDKMYESRNNDDSDDSDSGIIERKHSRRQRRRYNHNNHYPPPKRNQLYHGPPAFSVPPIGEILIEWPDDSDLCPDDGGIPKYEGRLPFTRDSAIDIFQWVAAMQMCFFDFVNDEMDYADLVAGDGITEKTLVCFDPTPGDDSIDDDCNRMTSKEINDDITTLRDYVDIHKQIYVLESFKGYSFQIRGTRTVGVELDLGLGDDYKVGTEIENPFHETYEFNNDGTLARRENHAKSALTKKLLESGKAHYVHFANAVDGIVDDNGNIPIGFGGKYMYVIDKRAAFVVVVLFVVAILTSISCCLMCKMCKSARNVVYKGVATESTDAE